MGHEPSIATFILIGLSAGLISGLFGIGGGIIIVPALIYLAGFSQLTATGTSLAILLPPVGLAAVLVYYRNGHVNMRAAIIIAVFLFIAAWVSSHFAHRINENYLRLIFGVFVAAIGIYIIMTSFKKI
ncbi:MAG: sulfite exporter TauE/SafE family protein [Spirochaetaceae bacterium]|nr:MAG: sulfite exporter TauE/SafE family protein [Spirochaetaceae bacterium]